MNDPFAIRSIESLDQLLRNDQRLVDGQRTGDQSIGERRTFNEFEHESRRVIDGLHCVDRRDVWMIERGEDACFTLEPASSGRVVTKVSANDLDGNISTELQVA